MATDYDAPRKRDEDDDVEALEEVKAATATRARQQPNIDEDENAVTESFELPGADLSDHNLEVEVMPQRGDEFVCASCFLVHHRSALVDADKILCRDCV